jgi:hypothetical protein
MTLLRSAGNRKCHGRSEDELYGFGRLLPHGTQHILTMYGRAADDERRAITSVVCKGGSHPGDASLNTPGFS